MRKTAISLAVAAFLMTSAFHLYASSLAGVTLPDTIQVGPATLVLNGMGLRTKFMVKVYVAGLYLAQKSSDPDAILRPDAPKRMVMHFVRGVSKSEMVDAFDKWFTDNAPDARKTMKNDIDRLLEALEPVKDGDEMVFTYVPASGMTLAINGREKLAVAGPAFARLIFSVWLGPKPPNVDLKKGLLGQ